MVKRLGSVLIVLIISSLAFADVRLLPVPEEKPYLALQNSVTFTADSGIEGNNRFVSTEFALDFYPFAFGGGFQVGGDCFDWTTSLSWFPLYSLRETTSWHFGLESIHHFQDYYGITFENDFVNYFCIRWFWYSGFQLDIKTGYHAKIARIYALEENLVNHNPALYLGMSKSFENGLELYTSASSHNSFRYQLFLEPHWILGLAWNFPQGLRPAFEIEATDTDFLATTLYVRSLQFRFVGRVSL